MTSTCCGELAFAGFLNLDEVSCHQRVQVFWAAGLAVHLVRAVEHGGLTAPAHGRLH